MGWERDIEELRRREALARQMGGPDKVKRQHDGGKLTVRERIAGLLDPDSFHEIGALAGRAQYGADGEIEAFQPANFVFGRGCIEGRPVVVVATTSRCAAAQPMPPSARSRSCPSRWRMSCGCRSCVLSTALVAAARSRPSK